MKFRLLKAEEIEVRVATIKEKGASLLLYKDARVDMNILDESGEVWKREHFTINGKLFCRVSIYDKELKMWVEREDVGVESNTEATKGEASDSFKRACFNWGIGRELYTAPFIWVDGGLISMYDTGRKDRFNKPILSTNDRFSVQSISYDDNRNIKSLVIVNDKTKKVVYSFGSTERPPVNKASGADQEILARAKAKINQELVRAGYDTAPAKQAFIKSVLKKDTIDSLNAADAVMDALENEKVTA